MKPIVHIVILYANEEEVLYHVQELSRQTAAQYIAVVIVINKKGDLQLESFKKRLEAITIDSYLYDPSENLGYLNGAMFGYEQYCHANQYVPDWVVVSNTDIEFGSTSFYENFLHNRYDHDVWCVGPSVYNFKKSSYDNPEYIKRCSFEKINFLIYIYERPLLAYLHEVAAKLKGKLSRNKKQKSQFMYSAKGCFLILRNELAAILIERKYKALMYSEESYIAEIVLQYNKKCYYDHTIEVIHNESTVTGRLALEKRAKYIADSLKIIRNEFYIEEYRKCNKS